MASNRSQDCHLQITVIEDMAICKCTDFNIWAVTLVPFSTWNVFSTSKGFMEARWWPVTSHRGLSFLHCFCLSWFYRWKGSNLSFLLSEPIPFSKIAFQIGKTSSSPAMLDTCLFLKIIRMLFKSRSVCKTHTSSLIMTCIKELWFLSGEGWEGYHMRK